MAITTIAYKIKVKVWKDKATGHWLMYSKKFDLSAYGKTKEEAEEMFLETVETILAQTTAWHDERR